LLLPKSIRALLPVAFRGTNAHPMALSLETALHRLLKLYRDAHHCEPPSEGHAINWAAKPELWAEHQIRFRNWSYQATESTVREARRLSNRISVASMPQQQQEPAA
jgi:hypothetical protein